MKNIITGCLLFTFTSGCVQAQNVTQSVTGTVVAVEPLTQVVSVQRPHTSCHTVDVPIYGGRNSTNDTIVGAVIGGAIGNQFGGGSGKDAATVLGAIIGADVANNRNNNNNIVGYRQENRCHTEYLTELQERHAGYRVTIEVDNSTITSVTDRNYSIGQTIQLNKQYSF